MKRKSIKQIIKEMQQGTYQVTKKGRKYHVRDVVEFDGDYGKMSAKQIRDNFG